MAVVCVAALYLGREIFIPLVLAILLSFVLAPIVNFLRRYYIPRVPAIIITVLLALSITSSIGIIIGLQIAELGTHFSEYQSTIQAKVAGLQTGVVGRFSALVHRANVAVHEDASRPGNNPAPAAKSDPSAPKEKPLLVRLPEEEVSPLAVAQTVLAPIVSPITTLGIVLVVVIFLLMQREDLRDRLIRLFGSNDLHRTTLAMDDAASRLSTYFLTQLGINAAFGVIVGLGLWAIGLPSPILWGVVATLLRFVPYVGSAISALLPIALAAAVSPGWTMVIWTVALFGVVETLMGQVVEPLLYGHSTGLSPVAVIVSALFWAWLWGPIGLILSTPFTVILVVLGRHVEHLEFLDVLLGDRPALTPIENFYQRILAGDPDEARDQAEKLLRDRPLIAYYDDVAVEGLRLAANDARRGVLGPDALETIQRSLRELLEDLERYDDQQPAPQPIKGAAGIPTFAEQELPSPNVTPERVQAERLIPSYRSDTPILCVAGRGPFDEAAATILAQLLTKHGLAARSVPHDAVSRRDIAQLDLDGIALVFVVYLWVEGSPSHLRYLLQRLRDRLPKATLAVGLWRSDERVFTDAIFKRELGADVVVTSMRQAVEGCIAEAKSAVEDTSRPDVLTAT